MKTVTCHCKNIEIKFEQLPSYVRDCDCPMCNRLGALWGDFLLNDVTINAQIPSVTYQWGDGDFEMHHCSICGCSTHYTPTAQEETKEIGVNMRMLDRKLLEQITIKN